MVYQNELQFLCETLRKSRVRTQMIAPETLATAVAEAGMRHFAADEAIAGFGLPEVRTLYRYTDPCDLRYHYLLLPETEKPTLLLVGPYLTVPFTPERLLELGRRQGVPPSRQRRFEEYYGSIPVLTENSYLTAMLTTFCERIWQSPSFTLVDVNEGRQAEGSLINEPKHMDELDDVLINMKTLEQRYAFENELIRAVSLGQLHKEQQLFAAFSEESFEQRLPDSLRNAKNYGVIMNTLLRKAAEQGGVHPMYLDRVSSDFAARIEQMSSLSQNSQLMCDMFRTYCRLVRRHTLVQFSPVVQKTVLLIDSDLAADLSLASLARHQNVSPGYLSAIFRRDTGKTLSEYIREKRIRHAIFLLTTTHQQIQAVAAQCGIVDVQYFSRIFKKFTGKTPKEYRETAERVKLV